MIEKIVSGGQTGVDTAALDAAINLDIPFGGWCPMGRINENGLIPELYAFLEELHGEFDDEQAKYNARTQKNIEDSDGTLVIVPKIPLPAAIQDGTRLTIGYANSKGKPCLCLSLSDSLEENHCKVGLWLEGNDIKILNIAGPRESSSKGICEKSYGLINAVLSELMSHPTFTM